VDPRAPRAEVPVSATRDDLSSTLVRADHRAAERAAQRAAPRPFLFLVLQCDRPLEPPRGCRSKGSPTSFAWCSSWCILDLPERA
jgi:hypothetical protein